MSGMTLDPRRIEVVDDEVARILRGMSGADRLRLAHEAWELARERLIAFVSARHPQWSPERVRREVAKRLGNESG
ncbi:MAG: hypothetical protein HY725_22835 [Candidatus Rokubacteria bacterium]|nr:hypothetical protein [Candidatus Rokubacteria bacterium]